MRFLSDFRLRRKLRSFLAAKPLPNPDELRELLGNADPSVYSEIARSHVKLLFSMYSDDTDLDKVVALGQVLGLPRPELDAAKKAWKQERDRKAGEAEVTQVVTSFLGGGLAAGETQAKLDAVAASTSLSADEVRTMAEAASQTVLTNYVTGVLEDGLLDPQEESLLQELKLRSKAMRFPITALTEKDTELQHARRNWAYAEGPLDELPEVPDVHIPSVRNERCLFALPDCTRAERRSVTKRIRYAGPTARIKIVRGIYFRAGDLGFSPVREEHVVTQDTGELYLTTKKLLFSGRQRGVRIMLNKIVSFEPYADGFEVMKETGRNQIFMADNMDPIFFTLFNRLLAER